MTSSQLSDKAIASALAQNWKEAIQTNTIILKTNKNDIEALLRLAFAYVRIGKITLAKQTYEKVISLDRYNHIAHKNLKKIGSVKKKQLQGVATQTISPLMFLEEPGRTKFVDCIHLAAPNVLSALSAGQEVVLKPRNHCVEVRSTDAAYLGALPDDISFKLIKFFSGGNTYSAVIKSIQKNALRILIRETGRGKRFTDQPSFTANTSYVPFSRGVLKSDGPDVTPTGEDTGEADSGDE